MKYALGLDIGTVSIGWSVINLDKNRIEDLGVRIFEKPENPKNGTSLAEPRRTARSTRRRLRRRRQRLDYLNDFFIQNNILNRDQINYVLSPDHNHEFNPYALRTQGLTEQLNPQELFVALYHIAKRRGYKSNRKSIEEKDPEGSRVLSAVAKNGLLLNQYATVGEALTNNDQFRKHKRNKADDYTNSFGRAAFYDEIKRILSEQQKFYPQLSDQNIQLLLEGDAKNGNKDGLFYQRPFMTDELINKMRGKCPLEKGEPRAPKASYDFEMFRLAQDLAHLSYTLNVGEKLDGKPDWLKRKITKGEQIFLTPEQIQACIQKCKATQKVTYRAIRDVLGYKDDPSFNFVYIRGKMPKKEELDKDPFTQEKNTFAELKFYHAVRKATAEQPTDWDRIQNDHNLFNQIGEILTCNKDDESIKQKLSSLNLSAESVRNLTALNFSGFGHLSIKAIQKITPHLLEGNGATYDKAMVEAGYTFAEKLSGDKTKLPPLGEDEASQITNPVVKRAISQVIKVVNAVIRKYGQPYRIGVECAGELSKNFKERSDIKKRQDDNEAANQKIIERLQTEFNIPTPTGLQISKFKFYNEQDGKCAYSGKPLDLYRIFGDNSYAEIDHIIPFSRCGNDSRANKVLVLNSENQEKGNRTPYEAWGNDPVKWRQFEINVNANPKLSPFKKKRLLATTLPNEKWNDRAINDTRYISVFVSRYLKNHLQFANSDEGGRRVLLPAGGITTYLRRMWHIPHKDRDADCLHHSVDATIIALTTQDIIADCAKYSAWVETGKKRRLDPNYQGGTGSLKMMQFMEEITNPITGEIDQQKYDDYYNNKVMPWPNFSKEIRLRESKPKENDNLAIWRDQFRDIYKNQDDDFKNSIHPIFVSRMPKRNGTGPVNKDTLRSPKTRDNDGKTRSVRMRLGQVKLKDLDNSITRDSDPELYQQLRQRLLDNNDDPAKAFAEPIYKSDKRFDKNGNPISPVSTIKVYSVNPESSGFLINDGKAYVNNGSMVRLDAYKKINAKGKVEHFFVPVYANQIRKGHPEIRPTKILPTPKGFTDVDDSFDFVCSLYPNDYARFMFGDSIREGYYVKYDINGGGITLLPQTAASKEQSFKIGARISDGIERLDINVLGDNYHWR